MKILKILIYFTLFNINNACCLAQFQRSLGGAGGDRAWSIVSTSDGGYAIGGETGSIGAGGLDFYIIKLDSSGLLQWNKSIGGFSEDAALSMVLTTDGGYVLAGYTSSFGTIFENDMMIVKLSSAGSVQWTKTIRGTGDELAISVIQTSDGGYAAAGHTNSFGAGDYDCFIIKLDSAGTHQWNRVFGGAGTDFSYSIVQTSDGGYAATGYSNSFGPGDWDMYIVKLGSGGDIQWCKTVGGTGTDAGYSIIQTTDGGLAVCGYTISFGAGYVDMYFVKLDSAGVLQWTRTAGGSDIDVAYSITKTPDGGFAAGGYTYSTGAGLDDMCIVKLDAGGSLQWSKTVGGALYDDGWSINKTTDNGYVLAGRTNSSGAGNYDMYFVKLNSAGNTCGNNNTASFTTGSGGTINTVNPSSQTISPLVLSQTPATSSGGIVTSICSLVGITPVSNEIPKQFSLSQNYPNPFNPATKIKFDIPSNVKPKGRRETSNVRIVIYDVSGKEIKTIVNEELIPGSYVVNWDGTNYPSGVYFYKLVSGKYAEAKKMLMVK